MNRESYDTAQVCLNGHVATSHYHDYQQFRQDYCSDCGEPTTIKCDSCETDIRGSYRNSTSFGYAPPRYCHSCGEPYPWTQRALDAARQLLGEFDELEPQEIERLQGSLTDLVKSGPQAVLAERRYRKTMSKVGPDSNAAMRAILEDIVNEQIRASLFGE